MKQTNPKKQLLKLLQKEAENVNRPVTSKETELAV